MIVSKKVQQNSSVLAIKDFVLQKLKKKIKNNMGINIVQSTL
jgi:hypothetical protein